MPALRRYTLWRLRPRRNYTRTERWQAARPARAASKSWRGGPSLHNSPNRTACAASKQGIKTNLNGRLL
eukprot:4120043-Prymnesium_polylepis.1